MGCWCMGLMQGPDSELAPESLLVGLDAVAGNVARPSEANIGQRCLGVIFLFSP